MGDSQFAMASEWMENGNINEFIKVHRDANRFELVCLSPSLQTSLNPNNHCIPVARRCHLWINVHPQCGDGAWRSEGGRSLKLVSSFLSQTQFVKLNILIDQHGHARLADFGLLTIVSDHTTFTTSSSSANAGTIRWMSPELLDPERFGFEKCRRTKESDCYALGMVILEVLSGQVPFSRVGPLIVMRKVIDGDRPGRPRGAEGPWFTDDLWEMLELCWSPLPRSRPAVEVVFGCLKRVSPTWRPLPPSVNGDAETDSNDDFSFTVSDRGTFPHPISNHGLPSNGNILGNRR